MKAKLSDKYYTFEQARAKLGMTKPRFQYWTRSGKLNKITPPNSKQGVYLKKEVDALAQEMLAFLTADEKEGLEFSRATVEDAQEEYDLAEFVFGKALHDVPTHQAWLNKNPDIDFTVRDNGRFVGFITIFPVEHETIMRFMRGEMRGWDLTINDLLLYTSQSEIECIVMDMATTPDASKQKRAQYGARLISGVIDFFRDLAKRHITVTRLYAVSDSPTGEAILRNAGFEEIGRIGKKADEKDAGRVSKRVSFELDTQTSSSLLARVYREALIEAKVEDYRQSLLATQQKEQAKQTINKQSDANPTKEAHTVN